VIPFMRAVNFRFRLALIGACAAAVLLVSGAPVEAGPLRVQFRKTMEVARPGSTENSVEIDLVNTGPDAVRLSAYRVVLNVDPEIRLSHSTSDTTAPYVFAGNSSGQFLNVQTDTLSDSAADPQSPAVLDPSGMYGLGIIFFDVPPDAPPNVVTMSFSSNTTMTDEDGMMITGTELGPDCTITISAVPEPASLALGGSAVLLVAGSMFVRGRRKRQ
jgi:hypothetical protein